MRRRTFVAGCLAAGWMANAVALEAPLLRRPLPAVGESLLALGLGTWRAFDLTADASAYPVAGQTLRAFVEAGGALVDSSPMYGRSSAVLGALAEQSGARDRLFLASKVWTRGHAAGRRQLLEECRRLGIERIDLMQVHNLSDVSTQLAMLREARDEGRVRLIGISHYQRSAHADVERLLRQESLDALQINYSIAEPEAENLLLPLAQDRGAAVLLNRVFLEGQLFRRVRGQPLPAFATEIGIASWAQYFLKWVLAHPAVTVALVGTGNPQHMQDNLQALRGPLPDAALRRRMAAHLHAL